MAAPVTLARITRDDLAEMKDASGWELLDGQLVERKVSELSEYVGSLINSLLVVHVRPRRLGRVYMSSLGICIFPDDPDRIRKADVSFVARERVPADNPGYLRVPPDLVVEVVSPSNGAAEMRAKVQEWLDNGVRAVWVAIPGAREVHVYRASGHHSILTSEETISGEDVLPGFSSPVNAFFPDD